MPFLHWSKWVKFHRLNCTSVLFGLDIVGNIGPHTLILQAVLRDEGATDLGGRPLPCHKIKFTNIGESEVFFPIILSFYVLTSTKGAKFKLFCHIHYLPHLRFRYNLCLHQDDSFTSQSLNQTTHQINMLIFVSISVQDSMIYFNNTWLCFGTNLSLALIQT